MMCFKDECDVHSHIKYKLCLWSVLFEPNLHILCFNNFKVFLDIALVEQFLVCLKSL